MNYYLVRRASDPKITGIKDGGFPARLVKNEFADSYTYDYFQKYTDGSDLPYWEIFDSFPDKALNMSLVDLKRNAKATDFIFFYPNAKANGEYLLSKRAADIIRKFNLPKHEFIPATVSQGGHIIDSYEYLFSSCLGYEFIDFTASSFFKGPSMDKKYVAINNSSEWEYCKDHHIIQVDNIVLKNVNKELDYFSVKVAVTDFYISERLKNAIEKEKLTGLNILPMKEPYEPRIRFN
jgi:hypothetical protein